MESHNLVLFIDGECVLCNGFARFVDRFSPECRFMCAQHQDAIKVLEQYRITREDAMTSIVLLKNGAVFRGSDAFAQILMTMNILFWTLGFILFIIPRPVREYIYHLVSGNRYAIFGKKDACKIPSPSLRSKFLHSSYSGSVNLCLQYHVGERYMSKLYIP